MKERKKTAILRQRLPFYPLLVCGSLGILTAHFTAWPSAIWLALFAAFAVTFFAFRWVPVFGLLVMAGFALTHTWQGRESAAAEFNRLISSPSPAVVTGVVSDEPRSFGNRASFPLRVSSLEWRGQTLRPAITLQVDWPGPPPAYGDEIRASGLIETLEPPRNPGQFDFSTWMERQGIFNCLKIDRPSEARTISHGHGNPLVRLAHRCRDWVRQTLTVGVNDPLVSNLLIGMVLGDVSEMSDHIQEQFRGTGTFHLFSVSGLHVSILAAIIWTLGRILCVPRRLAVLATIALVFFYVLLTGWKPASVRSAIMAAIVLCGLLAERKPILLNNLLAAGFLILLTNTNDLFNPGFQFSFCVVTAILLLATPLTKWIEGPFQPDPFLPSKLVSPVRKMLTRGGGQFASLAAVSIAAWFGSLPLTLGYFHLVSLTSLPANMIAVPVSFGIMAVSILSLIGGIVSTTLAIIFNQTNWLLTKILLGSVAFFASLPGSYFYVRLPAPVAPIAEIEVFDLGTGGAIYLESQGHSWLIDCGPAHRYDNILLPFLRSRGLQKIDGLLVTHSDVAHLGGGLALLDSCPPRLYVDSWLPARSATHDKLREAAARARLGIDFYDSSWGIKISPTCEIEVLYPSFAPPGRLADDQAAVLRVTIGDIRILLMSDAGPPTEKWLLQNDFYRLQADILIKNASRHEPLSDQAFLDAVSPRVVIAGAEEFQDQKNSDTFERTLAARDITVFRQGEAGAVTIRIFPEHCEISSFLNNQSHKFP